jgi:hypothetical protein
MAVMAVLTNPVMDTLANPNIDVTNPRLNFIERYISNIASEPNFAPDGKSGN